MVTVCEISEQHWIWCCSSALLKAKTKTKHWQRGYRVPTWEWLLHLTPSLIPRPNAAFQINNPRRCTWKAQIVFIFCPFFGLLFGPILVPFLKLRAIIPHSRVHAYVHSKWAFGPFFGPFLMLLNRPPGVRDCSTGPFRCIGVHYWSPGMQHSAEIKQGVKCKQPLSTVVSTSPRPIIRQW